MPVEIIRRSTIVDENPTNVISREVYRIFANVCTDNKGIVVWVVLKPEVSFEKGDWDVRLGSAEMHAFIAMGDGAEVFFPLTLHLVHWLI